MLSLSKHKVENGTLEQLRVLPIKGGNHLEKTTVLYNLAKKN